MTGMAKRKKKAAPENPWPERLRTIRFRLRLNQTDAAKKIHVSQGIWSAWERGASIPSESMQLLINLVFPEP